MDTTRRLEDDHRRVLALFDRTSRVAVSERAALLEELQAVLAAHVQVEETALYPEVRERVGARVIDEARAEHDLVRDLLTRAAALTPDEPGFGAVLDAAAAALRRHVRTEEAELFPAVADATTRQPVGTDLADAVAAEMGFD
jgi:iron-sulfur cluster repair protein YtfE (RIC family)